LSGRRKLVCGEGGKCSLCAIEGWLTGHTQLVLGRALSGNKSAGTKWAELWERGMRGEGVEKGGGSIGEVKVHTVACIRTGQSLDHTGRVVVGVVGFSLKRKRQLVTKVELYDRVSQG